MNTHTLGRIFECGHFFNQKNFLTAYLSDLQKEF